MKDWPFGEIHPLSADVIVIDCPWSFELYSEAGEEKSASRQYQTMSLEEIKRLPVGYLGQRDCLLLMWGCEWMRPTHREEVMNSWGFEYRSTLIWRKVTARGKSRMGTGYRVRTMHEPIYLGVVGNPRHKAFPSIFDGIARQHSRKPNEFYKLVEKHTPHAVKRLDLFSRETRKGWTNWGLESTLFDGEEPEIIQRIRDLPPEPEPMGFFPELT